MRGYEDIKMLQDAEEMADEVWLLVAKWDHFAKDTIAKQWVRATDSIGANIAESFGRFHYAEKINFLYYARGSTFECKYWLNRAMKRNLVSPELHQTYADMLTGIAKQVNGFAKSLKSRRKPSLTLREDDPIYQTAEAIDEMDTYSELQLEWLCSGVDPHDATLAAILETYRPAPNP